MPVRQDETTEQEEKIDRGIAHGKGTHSAVIKHHHDCREAAHGVENDEAVGQRFGGESEAFTKRSP